MAFEDSSLLGLMRQGATVLLARALNLFRWQQGAAGHDLITDSAEHTGDWACVTAYDADAVVETLTRSVGNGSWDGRTLLQGQTVYGPFTTIKRASGGFIVAQRN